MTQKVLALKLTDLIRKEIVKEIDQKVKAEKGK